MVAALVVLGASCTPRIPLGGQGTADAGPDAADVSPRAPDDASPDVVNDGSPADAADASPPADRDAPDVVDADASRAPGSDADVVDAPTLDAPTLDAPDAPTMPDSATDAAPTPDVPTVDAGAADGPAPLDGETVDVVDAGAAPDAGCTFITARSWLEMADGRVSYLMLGADHSWQSTSLPGVRPGGSEVFGSWRFEGSRLTLTPNAAFVRCAGDAVLYDVSFPAMCFGPSGRLELSLRVVADSCPTAERHATAGAVLAYIYP